MSPTPLHTTLRTQLTNRRAHSRARALTLVAPNSTDLSSNSFLSLSASAALKALFHHELRTHPTFALGAGGSRLLDGNSVYAETLEGTIARFHRAGAALLFTSGFDANAGFWACVPQVGDVVLFDEFIHASVHEGMRASRAGRCVGFRHNGVGDLERRIEGLVRSDEGVRGGERNVFIAVEGLYSMDGDVAPLKEMVECVERLLPKGNGYVVVDEAHSTGIYGEQGRGLVCSLGLEKRIFARLHTFGKALGCSGAAVLCDSLTRDYLINYARPLIYTTSLPFPSLAAITSAYTLMTRGATVPLTAHLYTLVAHLHSILCALRPLTQHPLSGHVLLHIPEAIPQSPIFSLITPAPRSLARYCQERGLVVRAIVPPTVPRGTQRVRVCLHAGNTAEEVERLGRVVRSWLEGMRAVEDGGVGEEEMGLVKASL